MSGKLCVGLGFICLTGWSCAQELVQGHVFTPEKGKADLALRAEEYVDRKSWQEKAARIRNGILEGAELYPLPPKTPLNPVRHSPKQQDGYMPTNASEPNRMPDWPVSAGK